MCEREREARVLQSRMPHITNCITSSLASEKEFEAVEFPDIAVSSSNSNEYQQNGL